LSTRDKSAAASQPENTPPASEASASIPSEPSQGRSGEDTSGSLREAAHLTVQDIAPDTTPPPVEGERPDQDRQQVGELSNSPEIENGPVTDVRDVATWVVDGHTVRLFGIDPHPRKLLASLVNWVRAKGAVEWNTSPASEALASIPSEPSQGRSEEDTSGSLQEGAHLVTQDVAPDPPPYLLSHPPEEAAAEPARSSGAEPGAAAPISGAADESRSAAVTGSAATDTELSTWDKSAAASQPENTSPASEASVSLPSKPSPGRSGEDTSSSPQEAAHLVTQDVAPDTHPPPVEGQRRDQDRQQVVELSNSPEVVNGPVTDVRDVATWVVDGHTVRLFGIDPGPPKLLASLVNWVRAKGAVECLPQESTQLYRCFTATGEDIAEAALLAGIGRSGEGATAAYQSAESDARRMGKGLWAQR
jgi:endonuclease YncB( thermonuclease family)